MDTYTIEQLKALAYDNLVTLEKIQNNIKLINEEIVKRSIPQVESETTGTPLPEKMEVTSSEEVAP